jgi:hypothetical protein
MTETVTGTLLAAAIAALGYVAKLALQEWREWRSRRAAKLARLVTLSALLQASDTAFKVQNQLARELAGQLLDGQAEQPTGGAGLEALFAARFGQFTPDQADSHRVIRGYTEHALGPINHRMSKWLADDTDYQGYVSPARKWGRSSGPTHSDPRAQLAASLSHLDAHLLLWHAKYAVWLIDRPSHALVYLDDESEHGLGFPHRVESDVRAVIEMESRR